MEETLIVDQEYKLHHATLEQCRPLALFYEICATLNDDGKWYYFNEVMKRAWESKFSGVLDQIKRATGYRAEDFYRKIEECCHHEDITIYDEYDVAHIARINYTERAVKHTFIIREESDGLSCSIYKEIEYIPNNPISWALTKHVNKKVRKCKIVLPFLTDFDL